MKKKQVEVSNCILFFSPMLERHIRIKKALFVGFVTRGAIEALGAILRLSADVERMPFLIAVVHPHAWIAHIHVGGIPLTTHWISFPGLFIAFICSDAEPEAVQETVGEAKTWLQWMLRIGQVRSTTTFWATRPTAAREAATTATLFHKAAGTILKIGNGPPGHTISSTRGWDRISMDITKPQKTRQWWQQTLRSLKNFKSPVPRSHAISQWAFHTGHKNEQIFPFAWDTATPQKILLPLTVSPGPWKFNAWKMKILFGIAHVRGYVGFQECTMIQDNWSKKRAKRRNPFSQASRKSCIYNIFQKMCSLKNVPFF